MGDEQTMKRQIYRRGRWAWLILLLMVVLILTAGIAKADGISQIRITSDDGRIESADVIWVLTNGPDFIAYAAPSLDILSGVTGLVDIFCYGSYGSESCLFRDYLLFYSAGNTDYYTSAQINNEVEIVVDPPDPPQTASISTPEPSTGFLTLLPILIIVKKLWTR